MCSPNNWDLINHALDTVPVTSYLSKPFLLSLPFITRSACQALLFAVTFRLSNDKVMSFAVHQSMSHMGCGRDDLHLYDPSLEGF